MRRRITGRSTNGVAFAIPTEKDSEKGVLILYGKAKYDYSHLIERLAEYEDAEENGTLVWLDSKNFES